MSKNPLPKHKTKRTLFPPPHDYFTNTTLCLSQRPPHFPKKPQICPKNSKNCTTLKPKTNRSRCILLYQMSCFLVKKNLSTRPHNPSVRHTPKSAIIENRKCKISPPLHISRGISTCDTSPPKAEYPIRTTQYKKQPGPMPIFGIGPELLTFISFPRWREST